jgi:hypothetical protein
MAGTALVKEFGALSGLFFADLLRALHISMVTNTDRAIVMGYGDSNTSQLTPSNSGLSAPHCRKWLCGEAGV